MLYGEFLSIVQEIQTIDSVENDKINYEALHSKFELDAERMSIIFEVYQKMGVGRQIEPVLDSLWKISLPFIPSEPFHEDLIEAEKSGDWRNIVKEWKSIKQKYDLKIKMPF